MGLQVTSEHSKLFFFHVFACLLGNLKIVQDMLALFHHIPQAIEQPPPTIF